MVSALPIHSDMARIFVSSACPLNVFCPVRLRREANKFYTTYVAATSCIAIPSKIWNPHFRVVIGELYLKSPQIHTNQAEPFDCDFLPILRWIQVNQNGVNICIFPVVFIG